MTSIISNTRYSIVFDCHDGYPPVKITVGHIDGNKRKIRYRFHPSMPGLTPTDFKSISSLIWEHEAVFTKGGLIGPNYTPLVDNIELRGFYDGLKENQISPEEMDRMKKTIEDIAKQGGIVFQTGFSDYVVGLPRNKSPN